MGLNKNHIYYLAGPMSGIPQYNFPFFEMVASTLRFQGYNILSPAEMDDDGIREASFNSPNGEGAGAIQDQTWGDFLARDVKLVSDQVDGVIVLPGWKRSRGARLELLVACSTGKELFEWCPDVGGFETLSYGRVGEVLKSWIEQHAPSR